MDVEPLVLFWKLLGRYFVGVYCGHDSLIFLGKPRKSIPHHRKVFDSEMGNVNESISPHKTLENEIGNLITPHKTLENDFGDFGNEITPHKTLGNEVGNEIGNLINAHKPNNENGIEECEQNK